MQIRIIALYFLLIPIYSSGQDHYDSIRLKEKLILTEQQNDAWLDSLDKLSPPDQLKFIIDRLLLDSNIYVYDGGDVIRTGDFDFQATKFSGCCKPIIVLNGIIMNFGFNSKDSYRRMLKEIYRFKEVLNEITIDDITVLSKEEGRAIFGSHADGVIILSITDKKSKKFIRKRYASSN